MPSLKRVAFDETREVSNELSMIARAEKKLDAARYRSDVILDVDRGKGIMYCPRQGCGGRVLEDQEHSLYCLSCGWRQESSNPRHNLDYIRKMFFRGRHVGRPSKNELALRGEREDRQVPGLRHGNNVGRLADDGRGGVQSSDSGKRPLLLPKRYA